MDEKQWVSVDQYSSIAVDEYNNKISIIQGNKGQNDVTYMSYCAPQRWKDGEKRVLTKNGQTVFVPWAISLGKDKAKAIQVAEAIVARLHK